VTDEVRDMAAEPDETDSGSTQSDDLGDLDDLDDLGDLGDTVAEPTTASDETETDAAVPTERRRRGIPPKLRRVAQVVLALLLLTSAGAATWLYFKQYRPDQQTDSSVKQAVANSASDGTIALLSYSSDTLEQDFANAKSHLAGDFLTYYSDFTQQIVAPAAKQRSLKTAAHVTGAAVTEIHPDSAVVLLFIDQTTTAKDNPKPLTAVSSVLVHMNRINGNWLITKFNPV
jgi:Mce-associated membrane protein